MFGNKIKNRGWIFKVLTFLNFLTTLYHNLFFDHSIPLLSKRFHLPWWRIFTGMGYSILRHFVYKNRYLTCRNCPYFHGFHDLVDFAIPSLLFLSSLIYSIFLVLQNLMVLITWRLFVFGIIRHRMFRFDVCF